MELEYYLIEEKPSIMAINRISQIIDKFINDNYYNFGNNKFFINEVLALNTAIQLIAYNMRVRRKEYYKKIDKTYTDDFTFDSVMYEDI